MSPVPSSSGPYTELREHVVRKTRLLMIDGNLAVNSRTAEGGVSARVHDAGYWGFASAPTADAATRQRVAAKARDNAKAMQRFGAATSQVDLRDAAYRGQQALPVGRPALAPADCVKRLAELHAFCRQRYPGLQSSRFVFHDEQHDKRVVTSNGGEMLNSIARYTVYLTLVAEDERGAPVEITETLSGRGSLADVDGSAAALAPRLDEMHAHLQAKRHAVPARGGLQQVVIAPEMAGILAHEAMGHPCEADIVLGGAVTGDLLGQPVASEWVSMVDVAHHFGGEEVMVPVYADDEGTPAQDALLIDRGVLRGFMSSRETAARLGLPATGNARAYGPHDEPLVRMRNTAILPGTSKLADLIAGIEDGYYLVKTGNGQADSTTEFMFAVALGYEIRQGRLGRAIRDTSVSGSAIKVLSAVDGVSADMAWTCSGYCGKKQPMVVSMGGPALRTRLHLGGE